ncbi:cytochrome-c peroxidase [Rhodovulum sp. DZ06]|uniref:cytochrome-c peroxidase n=1 Tax=Rhodovulum sp. DZ06 TaxID=3425126 RepID=UPI003D34ACF6
MRGGRLIGAALAALALAAPAAGEGAGLPDLGPRPVFAAPDPARAALGQLLFYDPILSGNRAVSCATCHHPRFGTSDGLALGIGDGGLGLGPDRRPDPENPPEQRVPRNAQALWNLGAAEFTRFFHDGRLEADPSRPGGIRTPLGAEMTAGFASPLAAQAMFPVLSPDEMAGHYAENEVSKAVRQGLLSQEGGAWDLIAARVGVLPGYRARFDAVLPGQEITFHAIANLLADFIAHEWRADDAPFDRAMAGGAPLDPAAARGMALFYGEAGCSACHSGWLQTDHGFHAIAMPQLGPGKAARFERHARDTGRMRVTGRAGDAYAFRTPSLRNVTLTAPYGHDGAYATLEGVIRHHLAPAEALRAWDIGQAPLPPLPGAVDDRAAGDAAEIEAIAAAAALPPRALSDAQVADLVAFLHALEDPTERLGVPEAVPSGLPVVGR